MRFCVTALLAASFFFMPPVAFAQTGPERLPPSADVPDDKIPGTVGAPPDTALLEQASPEDPIDSMLVSLKRTRSEQAAAAIAGRIDEELDRSSSATLSLLFKWADEAENDERHAAALDFLSEAIALKPNDVAAYRRRAVVHYTSGDYAKTMDDIRTSLELEPRDFAALGLMATILDKTGHTEAALDVWRQYLTLYPGDRDVAAHVDAVMQQLAGQRL